MSNTRYYAKRLYDLSITSPEVDSLNWEETEEYIRQEAEKLCLDPDAIIEEVEKFRPPMTDDFQTAASMRQGEPVIHL